MTAFDSLIDPMSGRQHPDAPERTLGGTSCGVRHTAETLAAAREVRRQFALIKAREKARVESLRADKVVPHERNESSAPAAPRE